MAHLRITEEGDYLFMVNGEYRPLNQLTLSYINEALSKLTYLKEGDYEITLEVKKK